MTQPLFFRIEGDDSEVEYLNLSDASSIIIRGETATIQFNNRKNLVLEDKKTVKSLQKLLDRLADYKERFPASVGMLAGKVPPKRS